jgi:hypothetical protein
MILVAGTRITVRQKTHIEIRYDVSVARVQVESTGMGQIQK